jgi:hypothetical protein
MNNLSISIIEENDIYEIGTLSLVGDHTDRKLAPNIEHGGNVHLNVLEPGARAGNHYHEKVQEFFINPGPGTLLLHLKNTRTGLVEIIEMLPASLSEIRAYHPKLGIPHLIENTSIHRATLIIVVDKDDPADVRSANVYAPTIRA